MTALAKSGTAGVVATAGITEDQVLAMVESGRAELERATAAGDPAMVAQVAHRAEALRYLAKKAKLGLDAQNAAGRLKVTAERNTGVLLKADGERRGGDQRPEAKSQRATLSEAGITRDQSARWQDMARVPDAEVADLLAGPEVTSAAIHRAGARIRRMEKITDRRDTYQATPPDTRPASVIYADPPWRYDAAVSDARKIENHYPTMTDGDIAKVDPAADVDAVLFLWVTSPKLPDGLAVMAAWGFTYKTSMVWVKPQIGMGFYVRGQHEFLLIGSRGCLPVPEPSVRPPSVIDGRRTEHSAKPDLRPLLDAMYPGLWKREMFSRRPPGDLWLVHGNETERLT